MTPSEKRLAFREILTGAKCIRPASVFDPLSARAAEDIGYELGMFAGSVASLSILGAPDIAVLTLSEFAERARYICNAGAIPLLVDADHGYGNALNARRTVIELECAGVAAMTLEDTALPTPFGVPKPAPLISVREAQGKLRAAIDARTDSSFVIAGRTNAALLTSQGDLLERQAALQEAGIDALFISGLRKAEDLDALAKAASVPLILGAGVAGLTTEDLAARKVRVCLQGHHSFHQAVQALYHNLATLRHGAEPAPEDPQDLVKRLSRSKLYAGWTKDYLE